MGRRYGWLLIVCLGGSFNYRKYNTYMTYMSTQYSLLIHLIVSPPSPFLLPLSPTTLSLSLPIHPSFSLPSPSYHSPLHPPFPLPPASPIPHLTFLLSPYNSQKEDDFLDMIMAVCMAAFNFLRALNFFKPVMVSCLCMVEATLSRF